MIEVGAEHVVGIGAIPVFYLFLILLEGVVLFWRDLLEQGFDHEVSNINIVEEQIFRVEGGRVVESVRLLPCDSCIGNVTSGIVLVLQYSEVPRQGIGAGSAITSTVCGAI